MTLTFAVLAALAVVQADVGPKYIHPVIENHGKVVKLPDAAEQPHAGSKICVDLTAGGPQDKLNPALEKVARFVNIYGGAGAKPAAVRITVVLHGNATATVLNNTGYAKRFKTTGNPNLPLIRKLKAAGIEFLVCGQALAGKNFPQAEVSKDVRIAVSALTVNVNRQQQGYAYIPLH